MELVRGMPITQYCDENSLPVRERLELFASVCQAIQHAHTKGHHPPRHQADERAGHAAGRPAGGEGDRLRHRQGDGPAAHREDAVHRLRPDDRHAALHEPRAGRAEQLDIDTRSDIYSLGVLLYELLTGTTPVSKEQLKQAAFDEIRRIIREDEPPKPSTRISTAEAAPSIAAQRHTEPAKLAKLVRGELDWIVMKALEKDRSRRYETASGFAADVQHYLTTSRCWPARLRRGIAFASSRAAIRRGCLLAARLALAVARDRWGCRGQPGLDGPRPAVPACQTESRGRAGDQGAPPGPRAGAYADG